MKAFLVAILILATFAAPAYSDDSWGNTCAGSEPTPDRQGRGGHWWFPKEDVSESEPDTLWGNRGMVYGKWKKAITQPPELEPSVQKQVSDPEHKSIVINNVLFDFDKAILKAEGKAETDKLIMEMNKFPEDLMKLIGHTCNVGPEDYNLKLGLRRAEVVKSYMVEAGIDVKRITVESKGETRPAVANDTPDNRKFNRRVEFHITMISKTPVKKTTTSSGMIRY